MMSEERIASLLHNALHVVCLRRGVKVLRISSELASALEAFPWSGRRAEMRRFWEKVMASHPASQSLSLESVPLSFRRRVMEIQECSDSVFK